MFRKIVCASSSLIIKRASMFGVASALNVETLFDFVGHNSQSPNRPWVKAVIGDCTNTARQFKVEVGVHRNRRQVSKDIAETRLPSSGSIYVKNYSQLWKVGKQSVSQVTQRRGDRDLQPTAATP
jgi:hypothetical protein